MALNLIPAYFILIIVLLLSFGIQVYCARRVKDGEDYALAGKGLGLLPTFGILASAGAFGGMTLGSAELAYTVGISAGWYACTSGIVLVIQGQFLATRFREALVKYDAWTMPELFEKWFGAGLREVYAWIYIPVTIVFLGGAVAGSSAPIISLFTGLSVTTSKVVAILIFASLILAGSYLGAAWQAFFILFFVYIGAMVGAFIAIFLAGGWRNLSNVLPSFPYFSFAGMGGIRLTALVLATGSGLLYDQFFWQMAAAANSDKTAKRGITLGGLIFAPIGFICAMIGLAIAAYKPGLKDPINYIPEAMVAASALGGGLFISGVLFSNICCGTVQFITSATIVMRNIYCRLVKRSLGQTEEVWVLRGIVALFAVLCILFNLFVPGTIIGYFLLMLTFGSSLIWPVLFGLFRDKVPWITGDGCFWGSILGFTTAFIWSIVLQNPFDLDPIFPTLTVSLISNIVISLMTQNTRKEMEEG